MRLLLSIQAYQGGFHKSDIQGQGREARLFTKGVLMGSRENSQSEEAGTRVHRVLGIQERSAIQGLVMPGSHGSSKHIVVDSSTGSKEMEPEGSLQLSSNMQLKLNSPLVS